MENRPKKRRKIDMHCCRIDSVSSVMCTVPTISFLHVSKKSRQKFSWTSFNENHLKEVQSHNGPPFLTLNPFTPF